METETPQHVSQSGSASGMESPVLAVIRDWNDATSKYTAANQEYKAATDEIREKIREVLTTNPDGFEALSNSAEEHITHDKLGWTKLLASVNQKMRVSGQCPHLRGLGRICTLGSCSTYLQKNRSFANLWCGVRADGGRVNQGK